MQIAKFPFTKIGKTYLGKIYRPYVIIEFTSDKIKDWIPAQAIVDTGADYTLLPKRYASLLEIDLSDCVSETTQGVGGAETIHLYKKSLIIKIGKEEKRIPVGFLERDDIPVLLGRLRCLESFRLIFDKKRTLFEK